MGSAPTPLAATDITQCVSNVPPDFQSSQRASAEDKLEIELENQISGEQSDAAFRTLNPPYLWAFCKNMQITEARREVKCL